MMRRVPVPVFFLVLLIAIAGCTTGTAPGSTPGSLAADTIPTITQQSPAPPPVTPDVTTARPEPYPGALPLRGTFVFGCGTVTSEATVYRYWINDTYRWHNDQDNHWYMQKPAAGRKYLFVFIRMENTGTTRVWFPPGGNIAVHYRDGTYYRDTEHFLPDKARDADETPVEVAEVQYWQKMNGDEYVEDFGYSRGTMPDFLYPGKSNAVDGYIVYEVPSSLVPEQTYVEIPFNSRDTGFWNLA